MTVFNVCVGIINFLMLCYLAWGNPVTFGAKERHMTKRLSENYDELLRVACNIERYNGDGLVKNKEDK